MGLFDQFSFLSNPEPAPVWTPPNSIFPTVAASPVEQAPATQAAPSGGLSSFVQAPTPAASYTPAPAASYTPSYVEPVAVSQPVQSYQAPTETKSTFTPPIANYDPWYGMSGPGMYGTYTPDQWMSMTAQQRDTAKANMTEAQAKAILNQLTQDQRQVLYDQNMTAGVGAGRFLDPVYDMYGQEYGGRIYYDPEYGLLMGTGADLLAKNNGMASDLYSSPTGRIAEQYELLDSLYASLANPSGNQFTTGYRPPEEIRRQIELLEANLKGTQRPSGTTTDLPFTPEQWDRMTAAERAAVWARGGITVAQGTELLNQMTEQQRWDTYNENQAYQAANPYGWNFDTRTMGKQPTTNTKQPTNPQQPGNNSHDPFNPTDTTNPFEPQLPGDTPTSGDRWREALASGMGDQATIYELIMEALNSGMSLSAIERDYRLNPGQSRALWDIAHKYASEKGLPVPYLPSSSEADAPYYQYGFGPGANLFTRDVGGGKKVVNPIADYLQQIYKARTPLAKGGRVEGFGGLGQIKLDPAIKRYVGGRGGGQQDNVPASLSPGEYVFDADAVAALGDGNSEEGARKLDQMRQNIRTHKRAAPSDKIPPKAKRPEQYLKGK
jgi:hypothetical protein